VIARHGRRRAAVASGVQQHGFHESSLGERLTMSRYSNRAAGTRGSGSSRALPRTAG
jgi:hypothetical protein